MTLNRSTRLLTLAVMVAFGLGSAKAGASPILDGGVTAGEYAFTIVDTPGETDYQGDLDIEAVHFDSDALWDYLAVTVVSGPISTAGSANTILYRTLFYAQFAGPTPIYRLLLELDGAAADLALEQYVAGHWVDAPLSPSDYTVVVGDAIELVISSSALSALPHPFQFAGQLDDTGMDHDDQITGTVPEPATLALLAMGTMLVVGRRRAA